MCGISALNDGEVRLAARYQGMSGSGFPPAIIVIALMCQKYAVDLDVVACLQRELHIPADGRYPPGRAGGIGRDDRKFEGSGDWRYSRENSSTSIECQLGRKVTRENIEIRRRSAGSGKLWLYATPAVPPEGPEAGERDTSC